MLKNEAEINEIQQKELRIEQLKLLYAAMPLSATAAIVNSSILVAIQWQVIENSILIGWLAVVYMITVLRVVKTLQYKKALNSGAEIDVEYWLRFYYIGIGASGIIWGVTGILLFPPDNITHQVFLVFVLAGMSAGAVTTLSSIRSLSNLFVIPCLLPIIIQFILIQTDMSYAMAFMIVFFVVMVSLGSREISKNIIDNISSRLRVAEQEMSIRKSETKLNHLLTSSPVVIYTCSTKGNFPATYISENVNRLFGYSPDCFLGDPDFWAQGIHPDDHQRVFSSLKELFIKGTHVYEYRFRMNDGSYRWVHDELRLIRDDNGEPYEIVGYWADINDKKHVEEQFIRAKEEAELANNSKSEFLSRMSHELRTPLNAILGFSQLLEIDELNYEQLDQVKEINKAGRHLLKLINEVLDISKIDAGKLELKMESVSLRNILHESISIVKPLLKKRKLDFIDKTEGMSDCYIYADETRIKQVMLNILSNAIKYNENNGVISLSCKRHNSSRMRIVISDTGAGLTPEQQKNIFQSFERIGAEYTEIEGTGIGLVISKRLTELMDGEIGFESTPGEGTTFWVEFNIVDKTLDIAVANKAEVTKVADGFEEITKEFSVLYVEDNPANLRLVEEIIKKIPQAKMYSAVEPELGLSMANTHKPDLILLDINLPGMNGYEVLKNLRQNPVLCNTPVIAISANAMPGDIKKGMDAGFDDYLTKPINVGKFKTAVNKALNVE